ncbi:unnamed protein product, partial [marine sediment metagenome]
MSILNKLKTAAKITVCGTVLTLAALPMALDVASLIYTTPIVPAQAPPASTADVPEHYFENISDLQILLAAARDDVHEQLRDEELNVWEEASPEDFKDSIDKAMPHIASELGLERVVIPSLHFEKSGLVKIAASLDLFNSGNNYFWFPPNRLYLGGHKSSLAEAMESGIHEATHNQTLALSSYGQLKATTGMFGDSFGGTLNETFTEIVSWEVLADLALNG